MKKIVRFSAFVCVAVFTLPGITIAAAQEAAVTDTAATTVELSQPSLSVSLHGKLLRGYVIFPSSVVLHGHVESRQRYLYLHLDRPLDVVGVKAPYEPVFHQYDIQVVLHGGDRTLGVMTQESFRLNHLIGRDVTLTGLMQAPGGMVGGPDWQPFPLTISVTKIMARHGAAK